MRIERNNILVLIISVLMMFAQNANAEGDRSEMDFNALFHKVLPLCEEYFLPNSMARPNGFDLQQHLKELEVELYEHSFAFQSKAGVELLNGIAQRDPDDISRACAAKIRSEIRQSTAVTSAPATTQDDKRLPKKAQAVIQKTMEYAQKRELKKLRNLMVRKFTWSFGGDRDADQAISEWRNDPKFLEELVQVLRKGCALQSTDRIECPGAGNDNFRAGFVKTSDGWKMEYFVAGD